MLLLSATLGVCLLIGSFFLSFLLTEWMPGFAGEVRELVHQVLPLPHSGKALGAFILGPMLALALNVLGTWFSIPSLSLQLWQSKARAGRDDCSYGISRRSASSCYAEKWEGLSGSG